MYDRLRIASIAHPGQMTPDTGTRTSRLNHWSLWLLCKPFSEFIKCCFPDILQKIFQPCLVDIVSDSHVHHFEVSRMSFSVHGVFSFQFLFIVQNTKAKAIAIIFPFMPHATVLHPSSFTLGTSVI